VGDTHKQLLARTPLIFQALYDNDVLDEDVIKQWYNSPPESNWLIQKEIGLAVRSKAKAFVEWLAQDGEDDE
jgi:hypothetical protein